mmetsp:Transcript_24498/g.48020  ORF Transcript_24498/g.48020 Transcript_24498/m.48020 type:complete len:234 (+) Transcript_24498:856-1557(+)
MPPSRRSPPRPFLLVGSYGVPSVCGPHEGQTCHPCGPKPKQTRTHLFIMTHPIRNICILVCGIVVARQAQQIPWKEIDWGGQIMERLGGSVPPVRFHFIDGGAVPLIKSLLGRPSGLTASIDWAEHLRVEGCCCVVCVKMGSEGGDFAESRKLGSENFGHFPGMELELESELVRLFGDGQRMVQHPPDAYIEHRGGVRQLDRETRTVMVAIRSSIKRPLWHEVMQREHQIGEP